MKRSVKHSMLAGALLYGVSFSGAADPFYLDVGTKGGGSGDGVTDMMSAMTVVLQSSTTFGLGGVSNDLEGYVTDFLTASLPADDEGLNSSFELTFKSSGIMFSIDSFTINSPTDVDVDFSVLPTGSISFYHDNTVSLSFGGVDPTHGPTALLGLPGNSGFASGDLTLTVDVTGGGGTFSIDPTTGALISSGSTDIFGVVSHAFETGAGADYWNIDAPPTMGFADLVGSMIDIRTTVDLNTDPGQLRTAGGADVGFDPTDPTSLLGKVFQAQHDGSVDFDVALPEPTTLSLLGVGLLGIGAAVRRRREKSVAA